MIRRLSLLSGLLLAACAGAQTLVPLDSRPATRVLPALIAGVDGGKVQVPPADLLGNAERGADPAALTAWLNAQPTDQPLIAALDTFAYGGLVQSRNSPLTAQEALARLQPVRDWQARTRQPVYAFITLPREPDATDRARNLAVVREMLQWARDGVFKELHVTWDDALPGSPAPAEGAELSKEAPANVRVYPGADEVLSMLAARALAPAERAVRVEYSDPAKAQQVIKYEGIPLTQSTVNHAQASSFRVVDSGPADLTLFVYNGGDPRQAAIRISALLRRGPVAVADVAQVNLGNPRLWTDLATLRQHANLRALAAWGTPGNNLGTALAHARLALEGADPFRQDALLAREYANDVIYSAEVRAALRKAIPEAELNTPAGQAKLLDLARNYFPLRVGLTYRLEDASLPWGRSFEWDFDLEGK
ncbi:DUF4127 family protein [Deinococcus metallilatus]|uniref:DUF4127 family protein n=1 Tax=Deinococcus metallilatus TaxID=1211322 RepID=A0AAJ5F1A8_9DEIO|nr:DUF4127 family protein [Deinococcus metallilatus]MBB5296785.1 hypothetical protein [Deinococcus metallilatus]QBY09148.1 DUF4127 family protein [Deinococcus metallilatus]RXJ09663.1 DUF4127 family protein [Deinococcus metallilatus]TLK24129.1 DUF4127 family protein [Deinococcus metallilatus]GMA13815.1 hypothetical protein GCM10025871_01460 [Deinococcus metallilatus]